MVPELELSLRTKGRSAKALDASLLRPIGESDLALLDAPRGSVAPVVLKLRDRHHALARILAQGKSEAEAGAITGYCPSRISILKASPAFRDLIEHYRSINDSAMADFVERSTLAALTAVSNLQDMLEDEENPLPPSMQLEIAKTLADRAGHSPVTKVQQTNINVDLGGRLAAARSRVEQARIVASLPDDGEA
jgi:hypothetical protein